MPRIKINLKVLPLWVQYLIAVTVSVMVIAAAWLVGRNQPEPQWITDYLIPIWRWVGTAILVALIAVWLLKKLKK